MSKSYDLSTSTKWANLADGDHVVKLRAKGAGFGTSSFSNSVTVTKGATGETWYLNQTLLVSPGFIGDVQFTCSGVKYNRINTQFHDGDGDNMVYYNATTGNTELAYGFPGSMLGNNVWNDQKYRTITFQTPPTGDLLTWLQANGTKQGVTEHTLTFSGVSVTVDGASVTSPYMLTKDCTIAATTNTSNYEVVVTAGSVEHHTDTDGNTLSLTSTDINIVEANVGATKASAITINYTT